MIKIPAELWRKFEGMLVREVSRRGSGPGCGNSPVNNALVSKFGFFTYTLDLSGAVC